MGAPSCPLCSTSHSACGCYTKHPRELALAVANHHRDALEEIVKFIESNLDKPVKDPVHTFETIRQIAEDGLWV